MPPQVPNTLQAKRDHPQLSDKEVKAEVTANYQTLSVDERKPYKMKQ